MQFMRDEKMENKEKREKIGGLARNLRDKYWIFENLISEICFLKCR